MTVEACWATYLSWMEELFTKKFQATYCGRFNLWSGIQCCIGCCQRSSVVMKIHHRTGSYTFYWWPCPTVLWQLWCQAQTKEPTSHQHTKHILHRYHLVREIVNRDDVELQKIDGKKNLIDSFTKALRIKEFDDFKWKMGIRYCPDGL